jgi:hypothetical protein
LGDVFGCFNCKIKHVAIRVALPLHRVHLGVVECF